MTGARLPSVPTLRSVGRVVVSEGSGAGVAVDNRSLGYRNDRATHVCLANAVLGRSATFGVPGKRNENGGSTLPQLHPVLCDVQLVDSCIYTGGGAHLPISV